jgi:hypothetical protein
VTGAVKHLLALSKAVNIQPENKNESVGKAGACARTNGFEWTLKLAVDNTGAVRSRYVYLSFLILWDSSDI